MESGPVCRHDGFVARTDHSTEEMHAWYQAGDVEVKMPNIELTFHVDVSPAVTARSAPNHSGCCRVHVAMSK